MTRRLVRWFGIILSVLTIAAWIGTASSSDMVGFVGDTRATGFYASTGILGIRHEVLEPETVHPQGLIHFGHARTLESYYWKRFNWASDARGAWFLYIPFWAVTFPLLGVTAWAWRPTVRAWWWRRHERCVHCGYDLSGIAENCPECGRGPVSPKASVP